METKDIIYIVNRLIDGDENEKTTALENIFFMLDIRNDYEQRCMLFAEISKELERDALFEAKREYIIRQFAENHPESKPLVEYPQQPFVKASELGKLNISKCIPEKYRKIFEAITKYNTVNPEIVIAPFISALNTCVIGKALVNSISNHNEELPLWTFTVADSGHNKSGVLNTLIKPLKDAEDMLNKNVINQRAAYERELSQVKKRIKNYDLKKDTKPEDDRQNEIDRKLLYSLLKNPVFESDMFIDDVTPEAVACYFMKHGNVTAKASIMSDESSVIETLTGLLYSSNGNSNLGVILKGYDGTEQTRQRVTATDNSNTRSKRPLLNVGVMGQSKKFDKIINSKGADGNGFIERFWVSFPERMKNKPSYSEAPELPDDILNEYEKNILRLWRIPTPNRSDNIPVLTFNSKVKASIAPDYYNHCNEMVNKYSSTQHNNERAAAWYAKQFARFARLAATYHIACYGLEVTEINEDSAYKALETCKFFEDQETKVFDNAVTRSEAEEKLLKCINKLREKYEAEPERLYDARNLRQCFGRIITNGMSEASEYIETLTSCKLLFEQTGESDSWKKPKKFYRINPWITNFTVE